MPEELRDTMPMRCVYPYPANLEQCLMSMLYIFNGQRRLETPLQKHEQTGRAVFRSIYGETADSVQASFNNGYPDLGEMASSQPLSVLKPIPGRMVYQYHLLWSNVQVRRRSLSVIASGSPRQMIQWHLNGPRRTGATLEEIQAVRKIAMEVASAAGINWKNGVPEVKDLVDDVA